MLSSTRFATEPDEFIPVVSVVMLGMLSSLFPLSLVVAIVWWRG